MNLGRYSTLPILNNMLLLHSQMFDEISYQIRRHGSYLTMATPTKTG